MCVCAHVCTYVHTCNKAHDYSQSSFTAIPSGHLIDSCSVPFYDLIDSETKLLKSEEGIKEGEVFSEMIQIYLNIRFSTNVLWNPSIPDTLGPEMTLLHY